MEEIEQQEIQESNKKINEQHKQFNNNLKFQKLKNQQNTDKNIDDTNINSSQEFISYIQSKFIKQWNIDNFQISKKIGEGKFGQVYLAREKRSKFIVALKQMKKSLLNEQNFLKQLKREIDIQTVLRHKNIIQLYGLFLDEDNIYMILEYAQGGELYKEMLSKENKKFDEKTTAVYVKQVCEALLYLHSYNIIHRDIKPENILNQFGTIKLADFGWSVNNQNKQKRNTICGTLDYLSPETVEGKSHDKSVDVWSLGILIFEFCTGHPPFETQSFNQTYEKIRQCKIQYPSYLSQEVKDLIGKLLIKNKDHRLSIENILKHQWIIKHNK